jgi:tRNA uridine 5-carboxymethylaminomethyl modification enzyme
VRIWPEVEAIEESVFAILVVDSSYSVYLDRQEADLASFRRDEGRALVPGLDYGRIPGLSHEMVERLSRAAPPTLGAAGRVPGVTAAALIALLPFTRRAA